MKLLPPPLLLAAAAALALAGCHDRPAEEAEAVSSRGLKVEQFDAPVPKAPVSGKLDTFDTHPEDAAAAPSAPAMSEAPPSGPAVPGETPAPREAAPAAAEPAGRAPGALIPQGRAPGAQPYDPFPGRAAASPPVEAGPPGFRITLRLCRRAEREGDRLAATPECTALLRAGAEQQRLCAQAFDEGNDAVVLSPACREAAGAR